MVGSYEQRGVKWEEDEENIQSKYCYEKSMQSNVFWLVQPFVKYRNK